MKFRKRVTSAIATISMLLLSINSKASAANFYFIGQVLEDTPIMTPVVNANVQVLFEGRDVAEDEVFFPAQASPLIATTDINGLFVVARNDGPEMTDEFPITFGFAQIKVDGTSRTLPGNFREEVVLTRDFQPLFDAAGLTIPDLSDLALAALERLTGVKIPVILSTNFVATSGVAVLKVGVCPVPAPPQPINSILSNTSFSASSGCIDFGDAPDSYKTYLTSEGPRYQEGELQRLGELWDTERDGQPTLRADGDDRTGGCAQCSSPDDEDGVTFGESWVDVVFNTTRPNPDLYQLRAWWDTNYNGIFDHTSELYIDDLLTLEPGSFTKRYNLGFNPKEDGLYSRFRLTWNPLDFDVKPFGEYYSKANCNSTNAAAENCVSHGEVEDYVHVPEPSSLYGIFAVAGFGLTRLRKKH
jgi:hypothetical protein